MKLPLLRALCVIVYVSLALVGCDEESTTEDPGSASDALNAGLLSELEPNDVLGSATPLSGNVGRVRAPTLPARDVDVYAVSAVAGNRIYAATITIGSALTRDTLLAVLAPDGSLLEQDDNDGQWGDRASSVAGVTVTTSGVHYLVVSSRNTRAVRPYDLYYFVGSGAALADVEPNGWATPQPVPANSEVTGSAFLSNDTDDVFAVDLAVGDVLFASFDARLGPGTPSVEVRGPTGVSIVGSSGQIEPAPRSAASFYQATEAGPHFVRIGSVSQNYRVGIAVVPSSTGPCHVYTSPPATPIGTSLVDSIIEVEEDFEIGLARVEATYTHQQESDIDLSLMTPWLNEIALQQDRGSGATTATVYYDGSAPIANNYDLGNGYAFTQAWAVQPDPVGRLEWVDGMRSEGTWKLRVRDDAPWMYTGTLTSWSLHLCERPPEPVCPPGTTDEDVFFANFANGASGFTSTGKRNEWQVGLPVGTAVEGCGSGSSCFKTDLDGTYDPNSDQDLFSPVIDLSGFVGPVRVSWSQRHQLDDAQADHAYVEAFGGSPLNRRTLWQHTDGPMVAILGSSLVQQPTGWRTIRVLADDLANTAFKMRFHLDSDSTLQLGGMAIDDVHVRACRATICGNGTIDPGEVCDDGNTSSGDGCDANCRPTACGNGVVTAGEQCDDANTSDGDGCTSACLVKLCGDGLMAAGEGCDDGNGVDDDGCDSNCTVTACGNGVVTGIEYCDDGNLFSGDGCSSTCVTEPMPREVEPNNTLTTATLLSFGDRILVRGTLGEVGNHADIYAFQATAGETIYTGVLTDGMPQADYVFQLIAPDGTVLEEDNQVLGQAAGVGGVTLQSSGLHYISLAGVGAQYGWPYRLAIHRHAGAALGEVEPNSDFASAQPVGNFVEIAGYADITTDRDYFAIELERGDILSVITEHAPPEGSSTAYGSRMWTPNGESVALGDGSGEPVPREGGGAMLVRTPGTYYIEPSSGSGGFYRLSVAVIPDYDEGASCKTYSSTAIAPGIPVQTVSNIQVTDNFEVSGIDLDVKFRHRAPSEIAAKLVTPHTVDNAFIFYSQTQALSNEARMLTFALDNDAYASVVHTGQSAQSWSDFATFMDGLQWLDGQTSAGTWGLQFEVNTLGISEEQGALLGWSMRMCRYAEPADPCPPGAYLETKINATFQSSTESFVAQGSGSQWARGLPAAPVSNCASGTACFKTNLFGNFTGSPAVHELLSPSINLLNNVAPVRVRWKQKLFVTDSNQHVANVDAVGLTAEKRLWEHDRSAASTGWVTKHARMDELAGSVANLRFHLHSATSTGGVGWAVDDVFVEACRYPECGDGIQQPLEACDDGNDEDGDGCDSNCTPTACGNGIATLGEACDDGDQVSGDGCDSNCTVTACGNGIVTAGEACDDGNLVDGDGCDASCIPTGCGNGTLTAPEVCDDGNLVDGDGCDSNCTLTACGNNVVSVGELCDDGDATNGDGCDNNCTPSACGNGIQAGTEECDDGNTAAGDGCSDECEVEQATTVTTGAGGGGGSSASAGGAGGEGGASNASSSSSSGGGQGGSGQGGDGGAGGGSSNGGGGQGGAGGVGGGAAVTTSSTSSSSSAGGGSTGMGGGGGTSSAGTGSAGGSTGGEGGASTTGSSSSPPSEPEGDGCGCAIPQQRHGAPAAAMGLVVALAIRRRRRRAA